MTAFRVLGGTPLHGTVRAAGNKNAALPLLAAALLTDEPVVLENIPDIGDVRVMMELLASVGADLSWEPEHARVTVQARCLRADRLPDALCGRLRAGILLAAPLLVRCGGTRMAPPGGDVIGRRRLDAHFEGLTALGAVVEAGRDFTFRAPRDGLQGAEVFLPEASVTATSQVLMAAAGARGTTVIHNAACEPHVQDVALLLSRMGVQVEGAGSNILTVHGTDRRHGARCRVSSDYTEAGSFLALAAATGGRVTVAGVDQAHYRMITRTFQRLGIRLDMGVDTLAVQAGQSRRIAPDIGGGIPLVDDGIWPAFPSDLMSVMIVMATQMHGAVLFFEKLYESRMYFVDRLVAMGANAVICDPHRAVICGPSRLHGITLNSPDIRAGVALLGAALCAEGESIIHNAESIDRGYERIDERLRGLGAGIERI